MTPQDANRLELAISMARIWHAQQRDWSGVPYILHPLRVMFAVEGDVDTMIVAVLHDVVEDTDFQLLDIYQAWGTKVGDAVDALTRRTARHGINETYEEYIERLLPNDIARKVKKADLADNSNPRRRREFGEEKWESLLARYDKATKMIEDYERAIKDAT